MASSLQAPARTAERGTRNPDPRRSTTSQLRSPPAYHTMSIITATRVLADVTSLATVAAAVTVVLPPRLIAAAAAPSVAAPAAAVARGGDG